ncbi:MAG: LLM class flavin-dependent oxidoreductase [Chloroflexi bacterium]|nr:LLM class flavin-dependent oxidoreductase [Chloroflexota bacterium]MCZ6891098.1 LLM class flavin-dependent oxidoreductase [Chloroflexota bacterium]
MQIGVAAMGGDTRSVLERILELERRGIPAAWLTTGGGGLDALTLFAAAGAQTKTISLGTSIVPTWPRHPVVTAQQVQVIAGLAPGRFRLGLGPSHKPTMEDAFGYEFGAPLTNLREYIHVVRTLLQDGSVDFDGRFYHAHVRIPQPVTDVPIMASALRRASFELCGAETDGAISWVCPYAYLRDVALPAMKEGAEKAGRPAPPLIAHAPVCVHNDRDEVRAAARQQLSNYPKLPFYARMFAEAGYPEAEESSTWSDAMLDAVVISGNEKEVAASIRDLFSWGVGEVVAHVLPIGQDRKASWGRTVDVLTELSA